jgi:23S rRNA pseudouridine2605 synthase
MKHSFEKFINKEKGSKKKEAIRQEKRKLKQEIRNQKSENRSRRFETQNPKPEIRNNSNTNATRNPEIKNFQTPASKRVPAHIKHQTSPPGRRTKNIEYPRLNNPARQGTIEMPLNKFVAHAGICSRREAAELVKQGKIKVNNTIINEPGFKVTANDKITVNNKPIHLQKDLVYILLNKPKDYITTTKDPEGRKTIFELIKGAPDARIFPVGRLDRNTTGVLLLTNDGELAQKLTHPSFGVKKIYEVRLDKPLQKKDMEKVLSGIELEDGLIAADSIGYADMKDKSIIGIEIHSGRNRIVRRMFEYLGYDVKNLDRVLFANLTKKNVDRGKWRYLNEREIRLLKYMNQSFVKKKRT